MKRLYTADQEKFISYYSDNSEKNKAPYVIFIHGFMSDMNGAKATHLENHCKTRGYNFIKFDNFGCGHSSGQFLDQTITTWNEGVDLVIENLVLKQHKFILIGSSAGAWHAMIAAKKHKNQLLGVIGIAPAFDFTELLIWDMLSDSEKNELTNKGTIQMKGEDPSCNEPYPINYQLILDGRKHLTLNGEIIDITCPVTLVHGLQDSHVPYELALKIVDKLKSESVLVKFIKDGTHSLSRPSDLGVISDSLDEMIKGIQAP